MASQAPKPQPISDDLIWFGSDKPTARACSVVRDVTNATSLTPLHFSKTMNFVSAIAGSGKTHRTAAFASERAKAGHKTIIVQPTKDLIDQTFSMLDPSIMAQRIHGTTNPDKVVKRLIEESKRSAESDGGEVIVTSQAALMLCPHFRKAGSWSLIIDEIPQVEFSTTIMSNAISTIEGVIDYHECIKLTASHDTYTEVEAVDDDILKKQLEAYARGLISYYHPDNHKLNSNKQIAQRIKELSQRVLRKHWKVYVTPITGFKR